MCKLLTEMGIFDGIESVEQYMQILAGLVIVGWIAFTIPTEIQNYNTTGEVPSMAIVAFFGLFFVDPASGVFRWMKGMAGKIGQTAEDRLDEELNNSD